MAKISPFAKMFLLTIYVWLLSVHLLLLSFQKGLDVKSFCYRNTTEEPRRDFCADIRFFCTKSQIKQNLHWVLFPEHQPFSDAVVETSRLFTSFLGTTFILQ